MPLNGWAAIYFSENRDIVGSVRRSKQLHWTREGALRELGRWLTGQFIKWQIIQDDMQIGRVETGNGPRVVVVTSVLLPNEAVDARVVDHRSDDAGGHGRRASLSLGPRDV
jgi:hypothetical protein